MSKTRRPRGKRFPLGDVYRTRDFGAERVATLDELVRLDPIPPSEPMPATFQQMLAGASTIRYVESDTEPAVRATRTAVGRGAHGTTWAVRLESDGHPLLSGRPGLGQSIVKIDESARRGHPRYASSYRPPWTWTEFLPRVAPRRRLMSEIDLAVGIARPGRVMYTMDYTGEGFVSGWPWTCVGKVTGGFDTDFDHPKTFGTGVLVGRNVLLTAAHLAIWDRGPGQWWMRFFPGFDAGPKPIGSSFVEQFRGPGPQTHSNPQDFVVCKLYDPLGDALGFFGYHWSSDDDFYYDQRWMSGGYPDFKYNGQRLITEYDIEVQDIDNDGDGREIEIGLNDFLFNGGWSGGPLWGWFPGNDPRVIGVCSGYQADGFDPVRSVFAGGGPMLNYISDARRDWS
jgi:hypothetical protein